MELVGFNGGTAYIRANFGYERYYWEEFTSSCQDEGWDDSGHVDGNARAMKVTGISPDRALVGTSPRITISGRGFGNSSSTSGEGDSGLTVNNDDNFSVNDTQISANMTIATNATPGTHHLTVHVGDVDDTVDFFVQIPKALVRQDFPDTITPAQVSTGVGPLVTITDGDVKDISGSVKASHRCGAYRNYLYQLMDQDNPANPIVAEVTVHEDFPSNEYTGPTGLKRTEGDASTNNAGYLSDLNSITNPAGQCLTTSITTTQKQHFSVAIGQQTFSLTTIIKITLGFDPANGGTYTVGSGFDHN